MYAVLFKDRSVARDNVHAIEMDGRGGDHKHVEYLMALKLKYHTSQAVLFWFTYSFLFWFLFQS